MTTGLPDDDLSDLGSPNRGEGLSGFFDVGSDAAGDPEPPSAPESDLPSGVTSVPAEPTVRGSGSSSSRPKRNPKRSSRTPGTATIYTSESVRDRLTTYRDKQRVAASRDKQRSTNLLVVFSAIEYCGDVDKLRQDDVSQLQEVLKNAEVATGYSGGFFSSDPKAVRYVGGGGAPVQFLPTPEQARELDELGRRLGFQNRSTWIAPLLNEFLPGRKDKR